MESKETKPTARGVYLDVENSPIIYTHNGKVYHFSSRKKLDVFLKKVISLKQYIDKLHGMLYRYVGNDKDYSLEDLYNGVYDKAYNEMLIK